MTVIERRNRSDHFDLRITELLSQALKKNSGIAKNEVAIAAVGGYGRGELFPGSDLDILILIDSDQSNIQSFVNEILYPLWDENIKIDHSVRSLRETLEVASDDLKVLIGLLDLRFIAGNHELVDSVAKNVLEIWKKQSRKRITELRTLLSEQHHRAGDLAYLLEPDIKESRGGLRDITALRALLRTERIEISLERISKAEAILGNVRESLHRVSGRSKDKLLFQEQDKVAADLGYKDADALMSDVSESARTVDFFLSHLLYRFEHYWKNESRTFLLRKKSSQVAKGVIVSRGEVWVDGDSDIDIDPVLPLRLAATAAQLGLPISLDSASIISEQLKRGKGVLSDPWPREAREQLVSLIGAGQSMAQVFETLEQEEILFHYLPEWSKVRSLPQRNALHRHTVDRHMVETAICAASYTRKVKRPDLLLVGALLHDIGKGSEEDHSERGSRLIESIAKRIGFNEKDVEALKLLVKEHLLLPATATRRDLDDPATIALVAERIPEHLELLHYLSFADGEATGKAAWSEWKAKLVTSLVEKVQKVKAGIPVDEEPIVENQREVRDIEVEIDNRNDDLVISIASLDRPGLLSIVAGVLSNFRLDVRSARTKTIGGIAYMRWVVIPDPHVPIPKEKEIRSLIENSLNGKFDLMKRINERKKAYASLPAIPVPPAIVSVVEDPATDATIIEIRSHDRPALLFTIGEAVRGCFVDIRAAIVTTLGAEAIDTLYVTEIDGRSLSDLRAEEVRGKIAEFL